MSAGSSNVIERVGVASAFLDLKLRELLWPEGAAAVAAAGGAGYLVTITNAAERATAVRDVVTLSGAFLAVIFTALAIVVSLPSSSYLRMLGETPGGGMWRFLAPFLVALGTQITLVIAAITYGLLHTHIRSGAGNGMFIFIAGLFVFGLTDLAALGRQLVKHGILRAHDAVLADEAREPRRQTRA